MGLMLALWVYLTQANFWEWVAEDDAVSDYNWKVCMCLLADEARLWKSGSDLTALCVWGSLYLDGWVLENVDRLGV
jgi:hypothetical protein